MSTFDRLQKEMELTNVALNKLASAMANKTTSTSMNQIDLGSSPTIPEPTHDTEVLTVPNGRRTMAIYRRRADGWVLDSEEQLQGDQVKLTFRKPITKSVTPDMVKRVHDEYGYLTPADRAAVLQKMQRGEIK